MNPEAPNKERLVRYLIGELSEEDQLRLEAEFFADRDLLRELQSACDDLMDDYLRGRLSASERQRCEQRLQSLPWLREKSKTDQAFLAGIDAAALAVQRHPQSSLLRFRPSFRPGLKFPVTRPQAIAAAIFLGLFITGLWYLVKPARPADSQARTNPEQLSPGPQPSVITRPTLTPNQPQPAPVLSPPPSAPGHSPVIASFLLSFDVVRGGEDSPVLKLSTKAGTVQLQLELAQDNYRSYQAVLQTRAGETIQTWDHLPVKYQQKVFTVALRLPASRVVSTDYVVNLTGQGDGDETILIHKYFFRIEKQ